MGGLDGLNSTFAQKLQAMMAEAPGGGVGVASGFRTTAQQQALWDKSNKDGTMVAAPGHSNHEKGMAADLSFASDTVKQWVHDNAARFGLRFPMPWEPWHIEPIGLEHDPQAATLAPQGVAPEDKALGFINSILGNHAPETVDQMAQATAGLSTDPTAQSATPGAPTTAAAGGGYQQAYQWVIQAGGTPEEARMLAAFAGPESGYNPGAVSKPNTDGTIDRGLFQINSIHKKYDPAQLLDPVYNAKAALDIYRTQGPKAWTTYNTGAYKRYLPGKAS